MAGRKKLKDAARARHKLIVRLYDLDVALLDAFKREQPTVSISAIVRGLIRDKATENTTG